MWSFEPESRPLRQKPRSNTGFLFVARVQPTHEVTVSLDLPSPKPTPTLKGSPTT